MFEKHVWLQNHSKLMENQLNVGPIHAWWALTTSCIRSGLPVVYEDVRLHMLHMIMINLYLLSTCEFLT